MHGTVRELETNMDQLSVSQQYANHGIYVLCKVPLLPRGHVPWARILPLTSMQLCRRRFIE